MNNFEWIFSSSQIESIGITAVHFLWQGAIVAVATAVVLELLRRRSARERYAACFAGMLAMLVAPAITFLVVSRANAGDGGSIPAGAALARNLGALRFVEERPDCFVFMDAHEEPATAHCLERLALAAIRTETVVCPVCKNLNRDKDFTGYGGRLAWYPEKAPKSRQGPGMRVEWAYKHDLEYEPVGSVYGGCYAMTPEAFLTLGGFMDTVGTYGYAEQALSLSAWFQGMERICYTKAVVRHLFRRARPYPMCGLGYWRNYVYCNRIIWSDDVFRTYFMTLAKRYCPDPMLDYLAAAPFVADLRDKFEERKVRNDEPCLRWLGVIRD